MPSRTTRGLRGRATARRRRRSANCWLAWPYRPYFLSQLSLYMSASLARPHAIIFDINETLLDLAPLREAVNKAFGDPSGFRQWFGLLLQHSQTATLTNQYFNFSTIGDVAFDMAATMLNVKSLGEEKKHELAQLFTKLPAHPDVVPGLARLRDAGFRLFTLTNSSPADTEKQLQAAGIREYFEQAYSVEPVRLYKPHPAPYLYVAEQAGLQPAQCLLAAAHGWDVAGALAAGLQAAFIARPSQPLYPLAPAPTYQAADIAALAQQLAG
ncbi:MAG: haloacid dehalogenase type II [Hymenobacter sp.]|nr:MAG: haloacid dehalogenase type II [Hymenobacter sp.]